MIRITRLKPGVNEINLAFCAELQLECSALASRRGNSIVRTHFESFTPVGLLPRRRMTLRYLLLWLLPENCGGDERDDQADGKGLGEGNRGVEEWVLVHLLELFHLLKLGLNFFRAGA